MWRQKYSEQLPHKQYKTSYRRFLANKGTRMTSNLYADRHHNSHSGHLLTEAPIDTDGQESISEVKVCGPAKRCASGLLTLEQEACNTAYAAVDPEAFTFVTGAGWIPNEEAACSKAFFGFFCKKLRNCNLSGHMFFRWGENRFQVTEFERLVVEDDGTTTFSGIGTINDNGQHEFMVHINDKPDSIDILISGDYGYDTGGLVDLGNGRIKIRQWMGWSDILTTSETTK